MRAVLPEIVDSSEVFACRLSRPSPERRILSKRCRYITPGLVTTSTSDKRTKDIVCEVHFGACTRQMETTLHSERNKIKDYDTHTRARTHVYLVNLVYKDTVLSPF